MKKIILHIKPIVLLLVAVVGYVIQSHAQLKIGNNPTAINADAIVEMQTTNKGMLLPRVALVSTTSPSPLSGFVQGMLVYDTVTAADVTPGMYYCDGKKWIKLSATVLSGINVLRNQVTVSARGQSIFNTPVPFTDANKVSLYRNGVQISFTTRSSSLIVAEIPCDIGDEIKIIQLL